MLETNFNFAPSFGSSFFLHPSSINYPKQNFEFLGFFELFDSSKIASNQYHNALNVMERILIQTKSFYDFKKNESLEMSSYFTSLITSDMEIFDILLENLKIIDNLENHEKLLNQQKYKFLKENSLEIDKIIEKNSTNVQQKPSPQHKLKYHYSISHIMKAIVLRISEGALMKSIETLKIKKDQIEIIVLSSLTKILLNKENVSSKEIYNLIFQHSFLRSKMFLFELCENVKFDVSSMESDIAKVKEQIDIIDHIDHIQRFDLSNQVNYDHLTNIIKWITNVLDLARYQKYHKKLSLYFNKSLNLLEIYGKLSNIVNSEIQDIQIQIDRKENLDTIKKLIDTIEEIKSFINSAIVAENKNVRRIQADNYSEPKLNESLFQDQKEIYALYSLYMHLIPNNIQILEELKNGNKLCDCLSNIPPNCYCFKYI